ncbi:hypothetical protein [Acidianus brierleyi]|uniref:Uncharacterized protein n=1 Tax=Acidianus brierleyi TaxID=41673 RepID=A0A2U9IDM3_9CREN|nr:hypothetical protein [Acidianus brierleyi]AWR94121.1 hypothetical protein DFR85_05460 [Acidianus brierleyi]
MITLNDIINVSIVREKYEFYENQIKHKDVSTIYSAIKDLVSFIKEIKGYASEELAIILKEQERIAKRIITVIRFRYIIIFLYKRIIEKLINSLEILMTKFLSKLS